jgi:hypothetical protein
MSKARFLANVVTSTGAISSDALSTVIDGAPANLNTLNEIAAAINDDPSYYTTLNTALSGKVPTSTTLTINGVSYNLEASRTWTVDALPSQSTHSGKFLTTDGTSASWAAISSTNVTTALGYTPVSPTQLSTEVANLIDAAPSTLNTLNELAAALGDDPNYATTITTALGTKVNQTTTLTINGVSYNLSENRTWTVDALPSQTGNSGKYLTTNGTVASWAENPAVTSRTISTFTATAGQTTYTVAYDVGYIDIFRNGVRLATTDYTASNGTTVVLATGANLGDTIETVAYDSLSVAGGVTSFSAGTTGLTPSAVSSGAIVLAGTLNVANGGTGTTTAFTAGSVVFAGSSGTYSQNNSGFFWDNTNSRLGIGTTSPSVKLDVRGSISAYDGGTQEARLNTDGNIELARTDGVPFIDFKSSTAEDYDCRIQQVSNGLTFQTGGNGTASERMRIDSSGNVLIGITTSPAGSKELVLGGDYIEGVVVIGAVGSSSTLSLANGTFQTATLTASTACTFTMPTAVAGKSFTLLLRQAASTGNGTATFTGVKWPAGAAPTVTATAGRMDIFTFMSDGTNWYGSFNQNYTP